MSIKNWNWCFLTVFESFTAPYEEQKIANDKLSSWRIVQQEYVYGEVKV